MKSLALNSKLTVKSDPMTKPKNWILNIITVCSPETLPLKQCLFIFIRGYVAQREIKLLLSDQYLLWVGSQQWHNDSTTPSVVQVQWLAVTAVIPRLCTNINVRHAAPRLKALGQVNAQCFTAASRSNVVTRPTAWIRLNVTAVPRCSGHMLSVQRVSISEMSIFI